MTGRLAGPAGAFHPHARDLRPQFRMASGARARRRGGLRGRSTGRPGSERPAWSRRTSWPRQRSRSRALPR